MNLLLFVIITLALIAWGTWVFFACIMNLKRVRDAGELTLPAKLFGFPTLFLGYILDVVLNITLGTLLFMELPCEPLFSTRLQRLTNTQPTRWRGKLALWVRRSLLDNIDPSGIHHG